MCNTCQSSQNPPCSHSCFKISIDSYISVWLGHKYTSHSRQEILIRLVCSALWWQTWELITRHIRHRDLDDNINQSPTPMFCLSNCWASMIREMSDTSQQLKVDNTGWVSYECFLNTKLNKSVSCHLCLIVKWRGLISFGWFISRWQQSNFSSINLGFPPFFLPQLVD